MIAVSGRGFYTDRSPQALFLLAPFTGVGDIAGSIVGETLASMFNLNQWNNVVSLYELLRYKMLFCVMI